MPCAESDQSDRSPPVIYRRSPRSAGRGDSARLLTSASTLLQSVLEVDPSAVIQVDPKVITRVRLVQGWVALRGLVEDPLLRTRIPPERRVRSGGVLALVDSQGTIRHC